MDILDNVAYYSCYKGYELNNLKYAKGRKCTKASMWEDKYEPFCKSNILRKNINKNVYSKMFQRFIVAIQVTLKMGIHWVQNTTTETESFLDVTTVTSFLETLQYSAQKMDNGIQKNHNA